MLCFIAAEKTISKAAVKQDTQRLETNEVAEGMKGLQLFFTSCFLVVSCLASPCLCGFYIYTVFKGLGTKHLSPSASWDSLMLYNSLWINGSMGKLQG